jgi:hypothetical protein
MVKKIKTTKVKAQKNEKNYILSLVAKNFKPKQMRVLKNALNETCQAIVDELMNEQKA